MSNWTCSCGQVNSGNFCIGCGKVRPKLNIASELQPTLPQKQPTPPVGPDKPPAPQANNMFSAPRKSANTAAHPSQGEGLLANKKLVFSVVGCVLLAAIFAMFSGKDKSSTKPTTANTTASTQVKPQTQQTQKPQQSQQTQQSRQTSQSQQTQQSNQKRETSNSRNNVIPPGDIPSRLNRFEPQIQAAGERFLEFHKAITDRRFNKAYDCYTRAGQQQRGARENFGNGYENTLSSEITSLKVVSADTDEVVFDYRLKARDHEGGRVKVQTFSGTVTMVKENGKWGIDSAESDRIGSRYE